MKNNLELVAPGGSLEKIDYAYHFGADAVYVGHPNFSLRARLNDFNETNLKKAVAVARKLGKKIYLTLNIYAHETHLPKLKKHLKFIKKVKPDAVIVSDPGILNLLNKYAPKIKIHLSTQANTTNSEAVKFWQKLGVSRIILAREVTLGEIKKISKSCPGIELEYFIHGAMCMSYSGRCLLSRWMRNRSANLGDCVQPCRWPYKIKNEKLKMKNCGVPLCGTDNIYTDDAKVITLEEDEQGTYFLNSRDLCLIEYLDKLVKAGISSFKIEGRTKSVYYASCAARAYRKALDAIRSEKSRLEIKKISKGEKKELEKLVNRGYSTGFLLGRDEWENNFDCSHGENMWQFVGEIMADKGNRGDLVNWVKVKIHNVLKEKDKVEIITPDEIYSDKVLEIRKAKNLEKVKSAHGGGRSSYMIRFGRAYPEKSILRKMTKFGEKLEKE